MYRTFIAVLFLFSLRHISSALPGEDSSSVNTTQLAEEVRNEFIRSWNAYKKYAWGHDGLKPLSKSHYNWYSTTFYMTAVDALDTMILMGFKEEADSTREYIVKNLSFDKDVYAKNFEFTIRLLGGLLSSFQLTNDKRLLALAKDLGDRLLPAFTSPTGMPYVYVNLKTGAVRDSLSNPAEIGTLLLEFGTLSKLTGDSKYYNIAKYALLQLYEARSNIDLVGEGIDITTGEWTRTDSHISGAIDSYYEYLLKCRILLEDYDCGIMWETSLAAIDRYLAHDTLTGRWYGRADMNTGKRTATTFGALDAFFPAVLVLTGDVKGAAELEESCLKMWNAYGIEPELFDYSTMKVVSPRYFLNPEIIESAYYLYQATSDDRFLRMGKTYFESLKKYCRTDEAYAELESVITKEKSDRMESYFMAETMKYLYLLFAPPETLDFNTVIFNTEAHPIRRTW